jgi:two-component system, NtrC family, response regulator AtoC
MDSEYLSQAMRDVMEKTELAAQTESTVLLTGESGSGKDFLARHIHEFSGRARGPYRWINCSAIPESLAESELFGYEKGAFTGATGRKRGLIELAGGGTFLFNEVAELSSLLQVKLLTFLDTKSFCRVGGGTEIRVDVRILAATNSDLFDAVEKGRFRPDLFYRLNVVPIEVPPLRHRTEDLPLLATRILRDFRKKGILSLEARLEPAVVELASEYKWPGNVRELSNVLERCIHIMNHDVITAEVFAKALGMAPKTQTAMSPNGPAILNELAMKYGRRVRAPRTEEIRKIKEECLDRGLTQQEVATALGVNQSTLSRWLKQLKVKEHPDEN